MPGIIVLDNKDNETRWEHLRGKMSENFRRTHMRNSTHYKSEQEMEEAYCKGYEHGYEDAMKAVESGSEHKTSEFKYAR